MFPSCYHLSVIVVMKNCFPTSGRSIFAIVVDFILFFLYANKTLFYSGSIGLNMCKGNLHIHIG